MAARQTTLYRREEHPAVWRRESSRAALSLALVRVCLVFSWLWWISRLLTTGS